VPIRSDGSASNLPLKDAKFYRERGIASYHNGDVVLAITDLDLAIRLDPNFAGAYDRAVALYRIREFDRAFADIAQAMRIKKSHRTATSSKVSRLSNNDEIGIQHAH
jgi:Flp pilus assembly protein TadD